MSIYQHKVCRDDAIKMKAFRPLNGCRMAICRQSGSSFRDLSKPLSSAEIPIRHRVSTGDLRRSGQSDSHRLREARKALLDGLTCLEYDFIETEWDFIPRRTWRTGPPARNLFKMFHCVRQRNFFISFRNPNYLIWLVLRLNQNY